MIFAMTPGGGRKWGVLAALGVLACAAVLGGCEKIKNHTFTLSANPAAVGQPIELAATARTVKSGAFTNIDLDRMEFRWDADGDGIFETSSRPGRGLLTGVVTSSITHTYAQPATLPVASLFSIKLPTGLVIGTSEDTSVKGMTLSVRESASPGPPTTSGDEANGPPIASFTVTPNPVEPHQQVVLDASASSDPDGSIRSYEWDLDQIPGFERNTGTVPRTTLFFDNRGTYTLGLRVTDNLGAPGTTTRQVVVRFSTDPRRTPTRATETPRFEFTPSAKPVREPVFQLNGNELLLSRAKAKGTLPANEFPAALRGNHNVRWAADYIVNTNIETGEVDAEAFMLLTFATGGRACLGVNVTGDGEGRPDGTFRVLGGIGKAARLRGLGTATGQLDADGRPLVTGTGRFRLADEANYGLGKGKCGPLRRLAPQRG